VQYGEDAVKEGAGGGGGAGGMQDIFDMFTGGGGRRGQPRERRGENVVHRLKVSLEEVYNGGTRCAAGPQRRHCLLAEDPA
jgi:DnaJ family protein A protein 2